MSKNPLIATPTVDRNGKNTTVYRKVASSAPVKGLPVPTLHGKKQGSQKHSTPLPVPEPMTEYDSKDYAHRLKNNLQLSSSVYPRADEVALLRDIIANGHTGDDPLLTVTGYMGMFSAGERIRHYNTNMLLLLERVCRDKGPAFVMDTPHAFADAVEGLGMRRRESDCITIPPIQTEEELASLAAVVKMMILIGRDEEDAASQRISERKEYRTVQGNRLNGKSFKNYGFASLVRERYEEYSRIEQFVMSRGVPSNKAGVEALRDYLDAGEEQHMAVAEGWL